MCEPLVSWGRLLKMYMPSLPVQLDNLESGDGAGGGGVSGICFTTRSLGRVICMHSRI